MNTNLQKLSYKITYSLKEKIVFVLKVLLLATIQVSFPLHNDFYKEYPLIKQLLFGLNTFLTGSILIAVFRLVIIVWYNRRIRKSDDVRGSFVLGINQIATILNVVFIVIGIMQALGIDPARFVTSITIVAMAIALIFRDYITNMISGLIIMFSDQYTIGDRIKIGEHDGKIVDITLSNIVMMNESEDVILIPNNFVFTTTIVNQPVENNQHLIVSFQLPYRDKMSETEMYKKLDAFFSTYSNKDLIEKFSIKISNVTHKAVHYKVRLCLQATSQSTRSQVKSDVMSEILWNNKL